MKEKTGVKRTGQRGKAAVTTRASVPAPTSSRLIAANSTARSSLREPYHNIASSLFSVRGTQELEQIYLAAARDGDFAKVEALLKCRSETAFSLDAIDKDTGNTALIWAAKRGHTKIVELMLRYGTDVTLRNYEGQTAIEVASPQVRQVLLDSADIGGAHRNLLQASWQGNVKLVKKILKESRVDINCRNSEGLSPLLLVTRDIQLFEKLGEKITTTRPSEVVSELLLHRADPNATDEEGKTALHYLASSKSTSAAQVVLQLLEEGSDLDVRDKRCFTPIHCASQSGNLQVVLALLDGGSDANTRGYAGATPLHISAINGNDQVAQALLQHGADVTLVDDSGLSPVDVAKTKKVKATLKQAWTEATQNKTSADLAPVKEPAPRPAAKRDKSPTKQGGQVIFDVSLADIRQAAHLTSRKSRADMNPLHHSAPERSQSGRVYWLTQEQISAIQRGLSQAAAISFDALKTSRSSASAVLDKHLSDVEKARLAEEQMKEQIKAMDETRISRPHAITPRSPTAKKRLTPIKAGSPRKAPPTSASSSTSTHSSTAGVKFGPGTKIHDGNTFSRHGSGGKGHVPLHKSSSDPSKLSALTSPVQVPVTILGLDLDDNLQEIKVKRIHHGPAGQPMPIRKGHMRHSSEPYVPSASPDSCDDIYLRGRSSSKASIMTVAEESEEVLPPAGSPPRLTPLAPRTPSAKNLQTIREYSGSKKPYILDLDRMNLNRDGSPTTGGALHTNPAQKRGMQATPTFVTETAVDMRGDIRFTDCSADFSLLPESERCSPHSVDGDDENDPSASQHVEYHLTSSKSLLKDGEFRIEDSRIVRTSSDSGLPDEKGSSSKSSSTNSSVSNLSAGSPAPTDNLTANTSSDHTQCETVISSSVDAKTNSKPSSGGTLKVTVAQSIKSSSARSSDKKGAASPSAKLRTIAQENAQHLSSVAASVPAASARNVDKITKHTNDLCRKCSDDKDTSSLSSDQCTRDPQSQDKDTPIENCSPFRRSQSIKLEKTQEAPRPRSRSVPRPKEAPPAPPANSGAKPRPESFPGKPSAVNSAAADKAMSKTSSGNSTQKKDSKSEPSKTSTKAVLKSQSSGVTSKSTSTPQTVKVRPTISAPISCVTTANISKSSATLVKTSIQQPSQSTQASNNTPRSSLSKSQEFPTGIKISGKLNPSSENSNFKRSVSLKVPSVQRPARPPPPVQVKTNSPLASGKTGATNSGDKSSKAAASSKPDVPSKPSPPPRPPPPNSIPVQSSVSNSTPKSTVTSTSVSSTKAPVRKTVSERDFSDRTEAVRGGTNQQTASSSKIVNMLKNAEQDHNGGIPRAPSEHTGPVIQDPFESLNRQREQSPSARTDISSKPKSAVTKKPMTAKKAPAKTNDARQTSSAKKKAKSRTSQEPPDAKATMRPKSGKKVKVKKKGKGNDKDNMTMSANTDADNKTFISGIGWHIETDCVDKSQVLAVCLNNDTDDSDEDSQVTEVNYPPEEGHFRRSSSERMRRSMELAMCPMPGQVLEPGQELSASSDEDDIPDFEAEAVVEQVVFEERLADDPTPRIVGERYGKSEDVYQRLLHTADKQAQSSNVELLPQTAKAIENFSKTVSQRDLMEMLESDTPRTVMPKDVSNVISDSSTHNASTILVQEAAPGSNVSVRLAPPQEPVQGSLTPNSGQSLSNKTVNKPASSSNSKSLSKPVSSKGTAAVSPGASRDNISKPTSTQKPQSKQLSPQKAGEAGGLSLPQSSQQQSSAKTPNAKSALSSKPKIPTKPRNAQMSAELQESQTIEKASEMKRSSPSNKEEAEINDMIDEILKSTPDPSLSLSFRQSRRGRKEKGMTKEDFAAELRKSQDRSFQQVPNRAQPLKTSSEDDPNVVKDGSFPSTEEEYKTMEKLANAVKNLPLKINKTEIQSDVKGKPPSAPKASNNTSTVKPENAEIVEAKSPRFIRKHDSYRSQQVPEVVAQDKHDSVMTDFSSVSIPSMADDSLVPSNRAEVVTSRLGRGAHSRSGSAMTNVSNAADEPETIQWKRGNMLGKGAFGTVWCGLTNSGGLIAVKQIELNIDNMDKAEVEYEKIQEEVELLKNLNHKNIVGYLGTSLEDSTVSIFMQFVPGGSIANILARFGALEEEVFCHYTKQILEGVEYLHANNVIHRDIKGGNIMLMPNGDIKLIDFGCAKRLCINMSTVTGQKMNASYNRLLKSMRGTPYWMAPEVVKEEGHGTKSDIWSVGCTVFEMATRKPPWADMPPMTAIFSIGSDKKSVPQLPDKFSNDAKDFTNKCMTRDQNKRPSATQLLKHQFIQKRRKSKPYS